MVLREVLHMAAYAIGATMASKVYGVYIYVLLSQLSLEFLVAPGVLS